jgi:CheY-like chemotaxis protein
MGFFTSVASLFGEETRFARANENWQPAKSKAKPTVLVIDDDANFLEMLRTVLGRAGYGVLTSSTGPNGLDMLRYDPRDVAVVLLDFKMPHCDGAETLKHLRKLKCPVKIIGISGVTLNQIPQNFQKGVERLVLKPFDPKELLQTIDSVLGGDSAPEPAASASV